MKSFLTVILIVVFIATSIFTGQADPFSVVEEKLEGISAEEKEVLEELFIFTQEIEAMKIEEEQIAQEINSLKQDIKELEGEMEEVEHDYKNKQDGLKKFLQSYQRMGPASYIEIILESESLSEFLRRINLLRKLTYGAGKLIAEVEESRDRLLDKKNKLSHSIALLEHRNKELNQTLDRKKQLMMDLKDYLSHLGENKKYYEKYLKDMQLVWNEIKNVVSNTVKDFSVLAREELLKPEDLNLSFSLQGIKGSIKEDVINDIIINKTNLEPMTVDFQKGKTQIEMPEKKLILRGHFSIKDGHSLVFEAEEGSFYGMKLETDSIEELFDENKLVLDLRPMIGNNSILKSVNIKEDYLELVVKWSSF